MNVISGCYTDQLLPWSGLSTRARTQLTMRSGLVLGGDCFYFQDQFFCNLYSDSQPCQQQKIFWSGNNLRDTPNQKLKAWAPYLHFDGSRTHVQVDTSHKPLSDETVVGRHFSQRVELLRHKVKLLLSQWLLLLVEIFQLKITNTWISQLMVWTINFLGGYLWRVVYLLFSTIEK